MSNNKQKEFKLIDVDLKDGLTFTFLIDKNKLQQHHYPINEIEGFFGGNQKINNIKTK